MTTYGIVSIGPFRCPCGAELHPENAEEHGWRGWLDRCPECGWREPWWQLRPWNDIRSAYLRCKWAIEDVLSGRA